MRKKHWGHSSGMYADVFGSSVLYGHQRLPEELEHDARLLRTRLGHYYLCLPTVVEAKGEDQAPCFTAEACYNST